MFHYSHSAATGYSKLLLFGIVVVALNVVALVFAQSPQASVSAYDKTQPTVSGRVVKREGNTLTLQSGEMQLVMNVPTNVAVQRNWLSTSPKQLEVDDQVKVVQNMSGEVEQLEAVSRGVLDLGRWLVPLTSGALASAILAQVAARKLTEWYQHDQTSRGSMVHLAG